ncbi:hypothetical protein CHARACLAT_008622 [Characodon lateralis]|uniref:Uncharacterized protein n=1 Tax=Characodon lateralis TaxID=208331 RepID=A0ABU7DYW4_9TELE|nr:hypothetical protein [Characodon lateralis]
MVEQNSVERVLICSDSLSSLMLIMGFLSKSRIDLVYEIYYYLQEYKLGQLHTVAHTPADGDDATKRLMPHAKNPKKKKKRVLCFSPAKISSSTGGTGPVCWTVSDCLVF